MCCDGTLFGRASLGPGEAAPARANGLRVVSNETSFEQPCTALDTVSGACRIYDVRPAACRRFECRLLKRGAPLDESVAIVRRARALLARVDSPDGEEAAELVRLMEENFERA